MVSNESSSRERVTQSVEVGEPRGARRGGIPRGRAERGVAAGGAEEHAGGNAGSERRGRRP